MKSTCLLVLAVLVVCDVTASGGPQGVPAEDEADGRTIDDIILQRAESLLLRSILKKMQDDDARNEGSSSQTEWVSKRQHPGKRYGEYLEKRQHPGKRDEDEEEEDQQYSDVQKRQHPGKRDDELHSFVEFQKRQHPGKRFAAGRVSESPVVLLGELSKRQHPGRRYLVLHSSKRQHPGKRGGGDEDDDDSVWDVDARTEGEDDEDVAELEKRQHPGKRFWDNPSPDLGTNSPCDALEPTSCSSSSSKTSLLLDFLDNINKSHAEDKRQHPGKRLAPGEDMVE